MTTKPERSVNKTLSGLIEEWTGLWCLQATVEGGASGLMAGCGRTSEALTFAMLFAAILLRKKL